MTKTYRVLHDGQAYTKVLTEAEVEALHRKYHGFISIREIRHRDDPALTFDYDQLAQEIYEHVQNS
jgi:hypothetical protein